MVIGVLPLIVVMNEWRSLNYGILDYSRTMRLVIPGSTLTALGFQSMFSSFFASILGMQRK